MAVNQQRGLLQVVRGGQVGARIDTARIDAPSSGRAEAFGQIAAAHGSVAREFAEFGRQVGAYADHAAAVEGARQGHQDGDSLDFKPTRAITIRGEAYDRAGLQVYEQRVGLEIENDIASGGDLKAKAAAWLRKTPEELHPEIGLKFRRAELTQAREAARAHAAQINAEAIEATASEVDVAVKGIHQRAYALGLDDKADAVLASDIMMLQNTLKRRGPDGEMIVNPKQAVKIVAQAKAAVTDARLLGEFSRLPSVEAKTEFILKIEQDWQAGEGLAKHYDLDGFQRITRELGGELRAAVTERKMKSAAVLKDIDELGNWIKKGDAPTPDQMAGIKARAATIEDPNVQRRLAAVENLSEWTVALGRGTPDEVQREVDALETHIRDNGPSEVAVARRDMAKSLLQTMRTELKIDPLGWADKKKLVPNVALDPNNPATVKARIVQAEAVAELFGQDPVFLRPDERQQFAAIAAQGGAQTLQVATTLVQNAGEKALPILSEVFKDAPVVAMIGGHVASAGVTPASRDAADGIALIKTDGFKKAAPEPAAARRLAAEVMGSAAGRMPRNAQAMIDMTNAAYEIRARRLGKGEGDEALWKTTLREVLGEREIGSDTYGGSYTFSWWSGRSGAQVIVPPEIKNDAIAEVFDALRVEDFGAAPPRYSEGTPVTAEDLARARPVQVGQKQFRLNLGDEGSPVWLVDGDKQPFVIDLGSLEVRLRDRVPHAYLGGGSPPRAATAVEGP